MKKLSSSAPRRPAKKTGSRFRTCPSCGQSFGFHIINSHLDACVAKKKPHKEDHREHQTSDRDQSDSPPCNDKFPSTAGPAELGPHPPQPSQPPQQQRRDKSQREADIPADSPSTSGKNPRAEGEDDAERDEVKKKAKKSMIAAVQTKGKSVSAKPGSFSLASPPPPKEIFPIFTRARKTIHLVRHGHTAWRRELAGPDGDPSSGQEVFDVPLSRTGVEAAQKLRQRLLDLCPEVIIVSPLTRALQTLTEALGKPPIIPTEVVSLHAEHVACAGDVGRPPKVLATEFPWFSFEGIPEMWWYSPTDTPNDALNKRFGGRETRAHLRERVGRFRQMLGNRPERTIAVIGHSTFFMEFASWRRLAHCEIYTVHL